VQFTPAAEVWPVSRVRWDAVRYGEMANRLYGVLLRWTRFANEQYAVWDGRPNCGHFFGGSYWYAGETLATAFALAVVGSFGRYDEKIAGIGREELRRRVVSAIRYAGFTHDTGPADCVRAHGPLSYVSGKKWGGAGDNFFMASQNGRSVAILAQTALLLWDDLDDETRILVQNVVASYADRWSDEEPRNGTYFDTQCEENAWTSAGIAAALAMFPEHPHRAAWREGFVRWALNAVTTPGDRRRSPHGLIDGLGARQIRTVTFHPDYTTENHGFVHPSYMCAGIGLRAFHLTLSLMTGREMEECAVYNNAELYERVVKYWTQFDGMIIPVQGQDWWYNRQHDSLLTHTVLSVIHGSRDAARFARGAMDVIERLQASNGRGCLLEERGEECIINAAHGQNALHLEHGTAYELGMSCLLYLFGGPGAEPSDPDEMEARLSGVREYPFGGVVVHRTPGAFSCFSWRNHVLAFTLPRKGMWNVTPLYQSMVGTVEFAGRNAGAAGEPVVDEAERWRVDPRRDGFAAAARLIRGEGELRQDVAFFSLPDGRSVYIERIAALRDAGIRELATGMVGVRNERYSALPELAPGRRTVRLPGSADTFRGFYGREPNVVRRYGPADVLNIDDEIGYLLFGSAGVRYLNRHEYPKWRGVEDVLALNVREDFVLKAGESLPPFAAVALPNRTWEETAAAFRESAMYEAGTDAVVLETGGVLAYADFGAGPGTIAASRPCGPGPVRLYEGMQRIRDGRVTWKRKTNGFGGGFLTSAGTLEFAEMPKDLSVIVCDERTVVLVNRSAEPASVACTLADGVRREIRLAPGESFSFE